MRGGNAIELFLSHQVRFDTFVVTHKSTLIPTEASNTQTALQHHRHAVYVLHRDSPSFSVTIAPTAVPGQHDNIVHRYDVAAFKGLRYFLQVCH